MRALMFLATGLVCAGSALAQNYPSKALRLILPFPAGGSADITARIIGQKVGEQVAQPVIVENRVGAAGTIGAEAVARSAPDGYTFMFTPVISHIGPLFLPKPPSYDPVRDFTPVSAAAESISALVVNAGSPFATVNDIVAEAKRSPGKLTYSSAGVGSAFHLTGELFKQAAGVDIVHVPYKGANQALADLLNGNITMTFAALGSLIPFAKSGKIKYVAILQSQRYAGLSNIPTVKEALPGFFRPDSSLGFFAPAALPAPVLTRLNAEIVKAINAPDVREKFDRDGLTPIGNSPAEFAAMVKSAIEGYAQAIKAAGFKPE